MSNSYRDSWQDLHLSLKKKITAQSSTIPTPQSAQGASRSAKQQSWIAQQITRLMIICAVFVGILGGTVLYLKKQTMASMQDMYMHRIQSMNGLYRLQMWYTTALPNLLIEYKKSSDTPSSSSTQDSFQSGIKQLRMQIEQGMNESETIWQKTFFALTEPHEIAVAKSIIIIRNDIQFTLRKILDEDELLGEAEYRLEAQRLSEYCRELSLRSSELHALVHRGADTVMLHEQELDRIKNITAVVGTTILLTFLIASTIVILRRIRFSFRTITQAFQSSSSERKKKLQFIKKKNDELATLAALMNTSMEAIETQKYYDDLRYRIASLARNANHLDTLTTDILRMLAELTSSITASLYLRKVRTVNNQVYLELNATYSCPDPSSIRQTFCTGEGIIGSSYEHRSIIQADIQNSRITEPVRHHQSVSATSPQTENYTLQSLAHHGVASALGTLQAQHYCAVPFIFQDTCLAVAEFGSMESFTQQDLDLFGALADNIASVLASAQAQQRIADLLEETQAQNSEIQLQNAEILEQKHLIEEQKEQSEKLLSNILPRSIGQRFKLGSELIADSYENVSVLFADMVGFTKLSARTSASELVQLLNWMFSEFDDASLLYQLEKIKTIGDCYMIAGGIPEVTDVHAVRITFFAASMLRSLNTIREITATNVNLRIGIHCGPCVAGVIGKHKFAYDLWGDSVNTASRMESHGAEGRIHVSERFMQVLLNSPGVEEIAPNTYRCTLIEQIGMPLDIVVESRQPIEVKGKGVMQTFFLTPIGMH